MYSVKKSRLGLRSEGIGDWFISVLLSVLKDTSVYLLWMLMQEVKKKNNSHSVGERTPSKKRKSFQSTLEYTRTERFPGGIVGKNRKASKEMNELEIRSKDYRFA